MAKKNEKNTRRNPLATLFKLLIFGAIFSQGALYIVQYLDSQYVDPETLKIGEEIREELKKEEPVEKPVVAKKKVEPKKPSKLRLPPNLPIRNYKMPSSLKRNLNRAKAGILIDATYNQILWSKNKDKSVPIASMTKIMTALLLAEAVEQGKINLDDVYKVTKDSSRLGVKSGSVSVWLDPRENVEVEMLAKAMMIRSANDAAYMISEIVSDGRPEIFIRDMNIRARQLGFKQARFYNPNGLPGPRNRQNLSSVEEIARLAFYTRQFPKVAEWVSTMSFKFITERRIKTNKVNNFSSTNPLLYRCDGVNGMKTGFTNKAGWCIAVTAERNGRYLIAVFAGMPSKKERNSTAEALIEWAYTQQP